MSKSALVGILNNFKHCKLDGAWEDFHLIGNIKAKYSEFSTDSEELVLLSLLAII